MTVPSFSTAVASLKIIAATVKKAGDINLYNQIIELQGVLYEQGSVLNEMLDENRSLKEQLRALEASISAAKSLVFVREAYWKREGAAIVGPFCSRCVEVDQKQVRMLVHVIKSNMLMCPACQAMSIRKTPPASLPGDPPPEPSA